MTNYKSEITNDEFYVDSVTYTYKIENDQQIYSTTNNVIFVVKIHDLIENLGLMNKMIDAMSNDSQTHVLYKYDRNCVYAAGLMKVYKKNTNYTRFTLEQFKKFYTENLRNILNIYNVYVETSKKEEDGWTIVNNKSKTQIKLDKIQEMKEIITAMVV